MCVCVFKICIVCTICILWPSKWKDSDDDWLLQTVALVLNGGWPQSTLATRCQKGGRCSTLLHFAAQTRAPAEVLSRTRMQSRLGLSLGMLAGASKQNSRPYHSFHLPKLILSANLQHFEIVQNHLTSFRHGKLAKKLPSSWLVETKGGQVSQSRCRWDSPAKRWIS